MYLGKCLGRLELFGRYNFSVQMGVVGLGVLDYFGDARTFSLLLLFSL